MIRSPYVPEPCDANFLLGLNSNLELADPYSLVRADINKYWCPTSLDTNFVSGGAYSDLYIYTALEIHKCDQEDL